MTINRVREYLRPDPLHKHPFAGKQNSPRLYFIRRTEKYPFGCHEVLTDIRAARRVEVGVLADGSKIYGDARDEKIRDHWLDCVRYAIGMRPALGLKAAEPIAEPGTIRFNEYTRLMDRDNARAKVEFRRNFQGRYNNGF